MKQLCINKSCWFFHKVCQILCLEKIFLSCIWFIKLRRYPASWAVLGKCLAQLAGYLLGSKNHTHERNIFFKQIFYQILWKNQQLLLIPSCFNFIPYPPYWVYCNVGVECCEIQTKSKSWMNSFFSKFCLPRTSQELAGLAFSRAYPFLTKSVVRLLPRTSSSW